MTGNYRVLNLDFIFGNENHLGVIEEIVNNKCFSIFLYILSSAGHKELI